MDIRLSGDDLTKFQSTAHGLAGEFVGIQSAGQQIGPGNAFVPTGDEEIG